MKPIEILHFFVSSGGKHLLTFTKIPFEFGKLQMVVFDRLCKNKRIFTQFVRSAVSFKLLFGMHIIFFSSCTIDKNAENKEKFVEHLSKCRELEDIAFRFNDLFEELDDSRCNLDIETKKSMF